MKDAFLEKSGPICVIEGYDLNLYHVITVGDCIVKVKLKLTRGATKSIQRHLAKAKKTW